MTFQTTVPRAATSYLLVGSRRAEVHYNKRPYSGWSERRMPWCSTAVTMACSGGSSLHGIRIRQAEDESGNQPLPEDHHHGDTARVCKTGPRVFILGAGRLSAGRFGLESFWLQIEVWPVRAGSAEMVTYVEEEELLEVMVKLIEWTKKFDDDGSSEKRDKTSRIPASISIGSSPVNRRRSYRNGHC
ncbi:uncharacterized protein LOC132944927 isoform X2 [Metopolophium dirhodum]|uniref:uncharacterized protein LOC132944927 isoform X2 n=1 Tax=Metopolophium dirhodum TaxID=44670 RepID=UPI00298FD2A3|nr:uncharacterized protein LOC132944927 isoform X2 [Metopolophium dirhodum]